MALTERLAILIDASSGGAVREFQRLSGEAGKTDKALSKGAVAAGAFKGAIAAIGLTTIATGMLKFAQSSIEAASALEEAENKARVVFGSAFPEIEKFAKETADALNLSERAAYDLTSSFGPLFKAAGYGAQDVAKLSSAFAAFAADFASFNDLAPEEAFQKILSGLSGEVEPLRRYGIQLSAAKVEAEAYSSGIAQVGEKLTEGQKVQARANLILKEGADALGDVERTATSYANVQRDLTENVEDLQAAIGQGLTPEVSRNIAVMADLLGIITDLAGKAGESSGAFDEITGAVASSANPLSAMWGNFTRLRDSIGETTEKLRGGESATRNTTQSLYDSAKAALEAGAGQEDFATAADLATEAAEAEQKAIDDLAKQIEDLGGMVRSAEDAQDDLTQSIIDSTQPVRDLQEAELKLQEAKDKVATAAGEAERAQALEAQAAAQVERDAAAAAVTLKGNSEAALRNRDAMRELADKTLASAAAMYRIDRDAGAAAAEVARGRQAFIDSAIQMGYTRSEAERLANQYGLIPGTVRTYIQQSGASEAIAQADAVRRKLAELNGTTAFTRIFQTAVVSGAPAGIAALRAPGGPVSAGRTYMVGEQGPELLTMTGRNGFVTSSGKTATQTRDQPQVVYNVYGYPDEPTMRALEQRDRRRALTRRLAGV